MPQMGRKACLLPFFQKKRLDVVIKPLTDIFLTGACKISDN